MKSSGIHVKIATFVVIVAVTVLVVVAFVFAFLFLVIFVFKGLFIILLSTMGVSMTVSFSSMNVFS